MMRRNKRADGLKSEGRAKRAVFEGKIEGKLKKNKGKIKGKIREN